MVRIFISSCVRTPLPPSGTPCGPFLMRSYRVVPILFLFFDVVNAVFLGQWYKAIQLFIARYQVRATVLITHSMYRRPIFVSKLPKTTSAASTSMRPACDTDTVSVTLILQFPVVGIALFWSQTAPEGKVRTTHSRTILCEIPSRIVHH